MLTGQRQKAPEALLKHYPALKNIADPLHDEGSGATLPLLA
jgi:hypothetical protein